MRYIHKGAGLSDVKVQNSRNMYLDFFLFFFAYAVKLLICYFFRRRKIH